MSEPVDPLTLVPGRLYRVKFDDCCVEGEFTLRFVERTSDDDDYYTTLTFEGLQITGSGLTVYEVEQ